MIEFDSLYKDFMNDKLEMGSFTSKNGNNENILVIVTSNYLQLRTFQSNGWTRTNTYYKNGTTTEDYER